MRFLLPGPSLMLPEEDTIHFQALRNAQSQRQQVLAQLQAADPARYAAAPARAAPI